MAERSFSHAIAEGDGISVIAAVEDADAARAAEAQRAEALVVTRDPTAVRGASSLPILWRADVPLDRAAGIADAYLLVFDSLEDDDGRLEELHRQALELGLDCAVEVRDEEEVEKALDRVDPEIFVLSPVEADRDETPLEVVLDLLERPRREARDRGSAANDARRGAGARARGLRCRDRAQHGRLAARRRPAARGLAQPRNGGTLFRMRAWSAAAFAALALVFVPAASSTAAKSGCPAAWRAGWQALANRIDAAVYCPTWMPNPLDAKIGGQFIDIDSVAKDRSYLDQLPRARGRRERRRARELPRLPGQYGDPDCKTVIPNGKKTIRGKTACFSGAAGVQTAPGIKRDRVPRQPGRRPVAHPARLEAQGLAVHGERARDQAVRRTRPSS